jgi:hypothetical protein
MWNVRALDGDREQQMAIMIGKLELMIKQDLHH